MKRGSARALVHALLAGRFVVELALFAAPVAIAWSALGGVGGLLVGLLAAVAVLALWGLLVSPRRRVDAPLGIRIAIEVALIGAACVGLALAGRHLWAVGLAAGEALTLLPLAVLGVPPGIDLHAVRRLDDR